MTASRPWGVANPNAASKSTRAKVRTPARRCMMIGEFEMEIDPIQAPTPLTIGLDLNGSGILVAHATNGLNGKKVECKLDYKDSAQMSPEELAKRRAQLEQQLKAVLGQGTNPLDGGSGCPAQPMGMAAGSHPVAGQGFAAANAFAGTIAQPQDVTTVMNPILRALYQKAINSFTRVPADRRMPWSRW